MTRNVLPIGRRRDVIDEMVERLALEMPRIRLLGGTGIEDMRLTFARAKIDHVVIGRVSISKPASRWSEICMFSDATTVHMNFPSGPERFCPFVRAVLKGLEEK